MKHNLTARVTPAKLAGEADLLPRRRRNADSPCSRLDEPRAPGARDLLPQKSSRAVTISDVRSTEFRTDTRSARLRRRHGWLWLCLGVCLGATGCLQEKDLSSDALTNFDVSAESGASGSQPRGAAANAAIEGTSPSGSGTGPQHEEKPGGFGSTEVAWGSPAPEAHAHESKPPGFGSAAEGATSPAPEAHQHEERPPGFGSTQSASPTGSSAPAGVPEAHEHKEMPPGYGSNLPPEGRTETVAVPEGGASGQPQSVQGNPDHARPEVKTPFETEYAGKKMVTIAGTLSYAEAFDGDIDLDCFVPEPKAPGGRRLVNKVKVQGIGPYSFLAPAGFGPLVVTGFIDLERDGPDSKDPKASFSGNPLQIKDKDLKGIDLLFGPVGNKAP